MKTLPRGLYAITPDEADTNRLLSIVTAALKGGAAILQYRNKAASAELKLAQASALLPICRAFAVPLILNDDLALALELDADGVHLGGDDGDLAAARGRLGPNKFLGSSCYGSIDRAITAKAAGADHIAFGTMFPSSTKPLAKQAPLELFMQARERVGLPAVGIGGVTLDNAPRLVAAGAHAVAVITALFAAPDITQRAEEFNALFI
ncbi:MAG TPA: thiamine phosphate synthase [Burkholderiales bacterium]|nr:thiamine phosphate synthase [Burkholderiales bacterium]